MKPLYFSLLLFVPFALGARYFFVCDTLHWCGRTCLAPVAAATLSVTPPGGEARELSLPSYRAGEVGVPASADYARALDTLAAVAIAHADGHALRIEAPILAGEAGNGRAGRYADIGVARAAAIADELQARGVPAERMTLHGYLAAGGTTVARFAFAPTVAKSTGDGRTPIELLADSMSFLGLRFGRDSTHLEPDKAFAEYADKLVAALNADTARRLRLIGHTDDRSTRAHNDSLGRWRAQAVAAYLRERGLRGAIAIESRGAREPAADNASPEGRYLNRRVEARIE